MPLLAASILNLNNKVEVVEKLVNQGIKWIHYDVMDGKFVDNKSLNYREIMKVIDSTPLHIVDVHLMTKKPIRYIRKLVGVAEYISFHYEACSQKEIEQIVKKYALKTKLGIAIDPLTPIEVLEPYIKDLSFVLIMSVKAGKGGQEFIPETLDKVKKIKGKVSMIQIDGGMKKEYAQKAINSGVDVVVSGSYLTSNLDKNPFDNLFSQDYNL